MANPNKTQAEFDAFFNRFVHALRKVRRIQEVLDEFQSGETFVIEHGDAAGIFEHGSWSLSGVRLGTNTDSRGRLYVRVTDETPGAGQATVDLYKATGGGASDKVASGSGSDNGTVTLSEANSSGISGTVKIGTVSASDLTDDIRLQCRVGYPQMDAHVFDGTDAMDGLLRNQHANANADVVDALRGAISTLLSLMRTREFIEWMGDFLTVGSTTLLSTTLNDNDGVLTLSAEGLIEELRDAMGDNTTPQSVAQTVVSAGSPSYDASNVGQGTLTVGAIQPNIPDGTLSLVCVDETVGSEAFSVTMKPSDTFEQTVTGRRRLVVGFGWTDPDIPVSLVLNRTYDKNGTDATNSLVTATPTSVEGIDADNSDDGVLYGQLVANGSNWDVEFYSDSGRTKLVAKATAVASGAAFTATSQNRSGLSITWQLGGAESASTFELDVNPFKLRDKITVSITRTTVGELQDEIRRRIGWYLEQSATPTVTDDVVVRGGKANEEML